MRGLGLGLIALCALARPLVAAPPPDRLAVSVALGLGSASLSRFHQGVAAYFDSVRQANPGLTLDELPQSQLLIQGQLALRYYAPHHLLAELGVALLCNRATSQVVSGGARGRVGYTNLGFEIPLLLGAHLPLGDRWRAYAALGPTLLLARSDWESELGRVANFQATRGGGLQALAGGELAVSPALALTVEARCRYLRTAELQPSGPPYPPLAPLHELDLSGVGLSLGIRLFLR